MNNLLYLVIARQVQRNSALAVVVTSAPRAAGFVSTVVRRLTQNPCSRRVSHHHLADEPKGDVAPGCTRSVRGRHRGPRPGDSSATDTMGRDMGRGPNRPGTSGARFTEARKEVYLSELRRTGINPRACLVANVSRCTVWKHRRRYPEFAEAEERALTAFRMPIENEIRRRAIEGVERTITVAGKKEVVREYSDRLLVLMLKRFIPEYRDSFKEDQRTEHSGSLALEADLSKLPPEGQDLLRQLLEIEIVDDEEDRAAEEPAA